MLYALISVYQATAYHANIITQSNSDESIKPIPLQNYCIIIEQ